MRLLLRLHLRFEYMNLGEECRRLFLQAFNLDLRLLASRALLLECRLQFRLLLAHLVLRLGGVDRGQGVLSRLLLAGR